jgi:hypothetical protein
MARDERESDYRTEGRFRMTRRFLEIALLALGLSLTNMAQDSAAPARDKPLSLTCYWSSYQAQFFARVLSGTTMTDLKKAACGDYQDPTHCERTVWEMIEQTTPKHFWLRLKGNGAIYTINSNCYALKAKKCKRFPSPGDSYDAVGNDQSITIRFEMPDNNDLIETFEVVDVSPTKHSE